jgi:excisionase family DNA binding protein
MLLTPKQAADLRQVSVATIHYWVKTGKLKPHRQGRNLLLSQTELESLKTPNKVPQPTEEHRAQGLITRAEAAQLLWVTERQISYYTKMGYVKRHYVLGNKKHYLVKETEVRAQVELIPQRIEARKPILRAYALNQPKDARGWFVKQN